METPALPLLLGRVPLARHAGRSNPWPGAVSTGKVAGVIRRSTSASWPTAMATLAWYPIALVHSGNSARPQRAVREAFGGVLIGHHALVHPADGKVVGAVDAPVVASAARMPETRGLDQADLPGAAMSSPSSQSSQALEARRRWRQTVSERSAKPISTSEAPRRRVDRVPRT